MNRRGDAIKMVKHMLDNSMIEECMLKLPVESFYADVLQKLIIKEGKICNDINIRNVIGFEHYNDAINESSICIEVSRGKLTNLNKSRIKAWLDPAFNFANVFLMYFLLDKIKWNDFDKFTVNDTGGDKGFAMRVARKYYPDTELNKISKLLHEFYWFRNTRHIYNYKRDSIESKNFKYSHKVRTRIVIKYNELFTKIDLALQDKINLIAIIQNHK